MDVVSTVMALFFMLLAVWSQSQLVALQQSSEAAPSLESPPSLEILYSRRVVTRGTTISAAVHVADGRVQSIVPMKTAPKGPKVTDYGALVISPGLVDIHVHLNEPGREEWEGFETGTKAAAAGGVTTVVDMPLNSYPTICDAATFDGKLAASEGKLHVDVAFWGGLVPQNAHNESVLDELIERGVVGLKTFMSPSGIGDFEQSFKPDLEAALKTLGKHQVPLMAHAELPSDVDLDPNADPRKYATYLATRPRKWEQDAIAQLVEIARKHNRYYTTHGNATIKCGGQMLSVAQAQSKGMEEGSSAGTIPSDDEIVAMAKAMLAGWE